MNRSIQVLFIWWGGAAVASVFGVTPYGFRGQTQGAYRQNTCPSSWGLCSPSHLCRTHPHLDGGPEPPSDHISPTPQGPGGRNHITAGAAAGHCGESSPYTPEILGAPQIPETQLLCHGLIFFLWKPECLLVGGSLHRKIWKLLSPPYGEHALTPVSAALGPEAPPGVPGYFVWQGVGRGANGGQLGRWGAG